VLPLQYRNIITLIDSGYAYFVSTIALTYKYNYLHAHTAKGDSAMFKNLLTRIQNHQQRRADYWVLKNMSNKELHDIGISRGEIYNRVYGEYK